MKKTSKLKKAITYFTLQQLLSTGQTCVFTPTVPFLSTLCDL